jgi:hypothetical protein
MLEENNFHCDICDRDIKHISGSTTTGYVKYGDKTVCYVCYGRTEIDNMLKTGKATLYLTNIKDKNYSITNWPGSFNLPVKRLSVGKHNIAGKRYDVWFSLHDTEWHGVTYGDNTQLCHCKQVKGQ